MSQDDRNFLNFQSKDHSSYEHFSVKSEATGPYAAKKFSGGLSKIRRSHKSDIFSIVIDCISKCGVVSPR